MCANRRIDAAAGVIGVFHNVMQAVTHAMQALEFKRAFVFGHIQDRGNCMGVMGGELRVNAVRHTQQFAGIGHIADVSGRFAGKDWEAVDALNLRQFDFRVPIGAFHQAHHDFAV